MAYTWVAPMDDLWEEEMIARTVDDQKILVVRMGETVYAYEDRCAHLGVALSQCKLAGNVLTCSAEDVKIVVALFFMLLVQ